MLLRNDLITHLSQFDNNAVAVKVDDILIDIVTITEERGCVVLVLEPEDLQGVLERLAGERADLPGTA
jgi:hypothetical protein